MIEIAQLMIITISALQEEVNSEDKVSKIEVQYLRQALLKIDNILH